MPRLRDKASRFVKGPGFAYIAVIGVLFIGVLFKTSQDASRLRHAQVTGCERGSADRFDHASVYRAMSAYYDGVAHAASVKRDVRIIARRVRDQLNAAARGQESRILLCVPLIDHGSQIPDRRLLRRLSGR